MTNFLYAIGAIFWFVVCVALLIGMYKYGKIQVMEKREKEGKANKNV